jgi:peptidyl-prolyl cis-trans isomerase A (cyclophilin A)
MKYQIVIKIILISSLLFGCSASEPLLEPDSDDLTERAPSEFSVEFNTTKGNILVEVKRENSPLAVDRFYYLVKNNYYNYNRFFRVLPNFVVQWGMRGVPVIDKAWENLGIEDEPVKLSNTKGTISFARAGVNSRSNQLFINLVDNIRLDTSNFNDVNGFPSFGEVKKGMEVVESINSEYMQEPNQDSISVRGNIYLKRNYPNLDYIISTKIIDQ